MPKVVHVTANGVRRADGAPLPAVQVAVPLMRRRRIIDDDGDDDSLLAVPGASTLPSPAAPAVATRPPVDVAGSLEVAS